MRLLFTTLWMSLTPCLSLEKWWDCLPQKCAMSLTSCWSYEMMLIRLPFTKMCYVTCLLSVIGKKDVMRLPFTNCAMSLTCCLSWEKMRWDCLPQKKSAMSDFLLVIGQDVMRKVSFWTTQLAWHASNLLCLTRCYFTAFHKMFMISHNL